MSDEKTDRGVDVDELVAEIETLRSAALAYARALAKDSDLAAGLGLDLEAAAVRYVRKIDEVKRQAERVDYLAVFERAKKREVPGN